MPNISMIEKVIQQLCAIDFLVSKYTFLSINQFIQRQKFLIDEDIIFPTVDLWHCCVCCTRSGVTHCTHFVALYLCLMCQSGLHAVL